MTDTGMQSLGPSDLFTQGELNGFLARLTQKKQEILKQARQAIGSERIKLDVNELKDEVDLASITIEQNLTFKLLDQSRLLLRDIDHAMDKITSGDFGYCEGTGDPIPKKRLELAPWVRYSVEFLEQKEKIGKLHNRKSSILEDMTS